MSLFPRSDVSLGHSALGGASLAVERSDAGEARLHAFDEIAVNGMRWLREPVVSVLGFARYLDEPSATQVREVAGDQRLREIEQLDEVAHAELARREQIEDSQPGVISEPAEQRFEIGDDGCGERRGHDDSGLRIGESLTA